MYLFILAVSWVFIVSLVSFSGSVKNGGNPNGIMVGETAVSPTIIPLGLPPFLTEPEKLTSDTINTQLTANINKYKIGFSSHSIRTDLALYQYSTQPTSDMILYFSEVIDNMHIINNFRKIQNHIRSWLSRILV